MKLSLRGVSKTYSGRRGETDALAPLDMAVREGEFISLVGPSGCGKSTLLHIVAGLEPASSGAVALDGERVLGPGAEIGLMFQQQTLFPWLSVRENVRFPLTLAHHRGRAAGGDRDRGAARVESLLRLVGLWDFRDSYPAELSGGMQQRAALARALVGKPEVLLMDEPFGALDAQTREQMQELVLHLIQHHRITTLFVTHDVDEALLLSDRVAVFSERPGRVLATLDVTFARAARSSALKLDEAFLHQKREILALLRGRDRFETQRDRLLFGLTNTQSNAGEGGP
ncbi:sulfonate ABC transporter ATP-binding protein [Sorangium cellulosum]|uniref:Sulfonate ABC transporter ATP-binding protein n=2 Tax=Sorangium cellulosum TaxID=56 RepID=A0A150Q538_SORCE|nr:ABC transporter ATP-binding protein [Sorangium cellulosum]AGP32414.1 phosphonate ABC transporter ATP-binding protein [Sorangium cellulosum So0157-2]KYF63089.1 sulfonate ABC transporter ATP-binding protein [Sorangium cellulosum]KYG04725.1 sulfonate ABC transporter ATP-binding protein [Sorangium cellulosum]